MLTASIKILRPEESNRTTVGGRRPAENAGGREDEGLLLRLTLKELLIMLGAGRRDTIYTYDRLK